MNLKRCPFCFGIADISIGEHSFNDVKIRCRDCCAEGPLFDTDGPESFCESPDQIERNVELAAAHWNKRA